MYGRGIREASNIGFSLNMAGKSYRRDALLTVCLFAFTVGFSSMILWWVRILNEVEVNGELLLYLPSYVSDQFV